MSVIAIIPLSLLGLVSLVTTAVEGTCQTGPNFTQPGLLYNNINGCVFPADTLTQACVSASCPSLASSGTCPEDSDGMIDTASLMTQLNTCFASLTSVCGSGWQTAKLPQMGIGQSVPVVGSFVCFISAAGVTASGLQSTTITSINSPGPNTLVIAFSTPCVTITGNFQCVVTPPFLSPVTLTLTATYSASYVSSATITLGSPPTIGPISTTGSSSAFDVNVAPQSGGVVGAVTSILPSTVTNTLLSTLTNIATNCGDDAAFTTFAATYATLAFQALKAKCPSS